MVVEFVYMYIVLQLTDFNILIHTFLLNFTIANTENNQVT